MSSPITSTATRSGSRVVVTRNEDVIAGAAPLVTIFTDELDIMSFAPNTAVTLAHMLLRAATTEVALGIRVTNTYAETGETFVHDYCISAPAPADDAGVDDWMLDHLFQHTGEGGAYAEYDALYEVEILTAPAGFGHLVGSRMSAMR